MALTINPQQLLQDYIEKMCSEPGISHWLNAQKLIQETAWTRSQSNDTFRVVKSPVFTYSNPNFPDATVNILREHLGTNDPRHPNPQAGKGSAYHFILYRGIDRINRSYRTLEVAKMNAKTLHERLVDEETERRSEEMRRKLAGNPNYGRF